MRLTTRGKRRVLILAMGFLALGLVLAGFVGLRGIYRTRLMAQARDAGLEAYKHGQYETALSKLSYALTPTSTDIEMLLAFADSRARVVEVNNRHLLTAIAYYNAALKVDPQNLTALSSLLQLYRRVGYRTEAVETADRIIAVDPDDLDAWIAKSSVAYQRQAFDEVVAIAERMSQRFPSDLSWRRLQIKALRAKGLDEDTVIASCDEWIKANPRAGILQLLKAQTLAEYGRHSEAREELVGVLQQDIDSPAMLESTIALLETLEMRVEADQLISRSKERFPDLSWVFESSIRRHWQASRTSDALAELAIAESKFGQNQLSLLKWKALLNAAVGNTVEASQALTAMREFARKSQPAEQQGTLSWVHAIEGRLNAESMNWRQLAEVYERAISSHTSDPILLFLLAEHYQRIGEHQLALELLNRAASSDPNWLALHVARADVLLSLQKPEDSFAVAGAVIKRAPSAGAAAYLVLCRAWFALGDRADQIAIVDGGVNAQMTLVDLVRSLHQRAKRDPQVNRLLISVLMKRGLKDECNAVIQQAMADPEASPVVLLALCDSSVEHQLGLETALLEEIHERAPGNAELALQESAILQRMGRTSEAIDLLQRFMAGRDPAAVRDLQWLRARLMVETKQDGGESDLLRLIQTETQPLPLLSLLDNETIWTNRQVIKSTIDSLHAMFAERAPRVELARAAFLYRFERESPASIAEALEIVNNVLRENPDAKQAMALMAQLQICGDNPDPDEALRYLTRAVTLYPDDGNLLSQLVLMLQERGNYDEVRQLLSRSIRQPRSDNSLIRLQANLLANQGDFDLALEALRSIPEAELVERDQIEMAFMEAKTGDVAAAEARFMRAAEAPGASTEAFIAAAQFCAARGLVEEALNLLTRGVPANQPFLAQYYRGAILMQIGDITGAETALVRAAELNAADVRVWIELTKLNVAKGALQSARDAALKAIELDPQNESAQAMLAMVCLTLGEGDRQHAIHALTRLQNQNPGLERTIRLYAALSNPTEKDLADAKDLAREHPRWSAAWKLVVTMHANAGRFEDAIYLAKQAVTWMPADANALEMSARLLIQEGRLQEALEMARNWRRLTRDDPLLADSVIAAILLDLGQPQDAFEQLKPHLDRLVTGGDRFQNQLEVALMALMESDRAHDAQTIMQGLVSNAAWRSRLLGMTSKLGQNSSERVMRLIEPRCQSSVDQLELASAWIAHGKRFADSSALQHAQDLLARGVVDQQIQTDALVLQADIAAAIQQWPRAEELYRQALGYNAQHPAALNNLAYLLIRGGTKCEEAAALAAQAAAITRNNPMVLDTLAQANLCLGRHTEAERWAKAALQQLPNDPSLLITLATIRHVQGRGQEALVDLKKASNAVGRQRFPDAESKGRLEELEKLLTRQSSTAG